MKLNVPLSFQVSAYGLSASFSNPAALIALRTTALAGSSPAGRAAGIDRQSATDTRVNNRMVQSPVWESSSEQQPTKGAAICKRKMAECRRWDLNPHSREGTGF